MEISICQGHPVAPLLMMVDLPAALGFAQPSRNIWDRGLRGIHGPFKICASMICLSLKGDGFQCTVAQIAEGYLEYLTESSSYFYTFCLLSKILQSFIAIPQNPIRNIFIGDGLFLAHYLICHVYKFPHGLIWHWLVYEIKDNNYFCGNCIFDIRRFPETQCFFFGGGILCKTHSALYRCLKPSHFGGGWCPQGMSVYKPHEIAMKSFDVSPINHSCPLGIYSSYGKSPIFNR